MSEQDTSMTRELVDQCLAYLKETDNRSTIEDYVIQPTMDIASDKLFTILYQRIFPFLRVLSGLYLLIIILLLVIIYLVVKRTQA